MLVVSLRGVNLGFWSHLGCSGQNAIIFSRDRSPWLRRSPLGLHAKKIQKYVYCLCFKMVSFRGQEKLEPRPDRSPLRV